MKRSLLPVIKVFCILFVPGVLTLYLASLVAKKNTFKKVKSLNLRPQIKRNYHD